jgi:hypothetical protein
MEKRCVTCTDKHKINEFLDIGIGGLIQLFNVKVSSKGTLFVTANSGVKKKVPSSSDCCSKRRIRSVEKFKLEEFKFSDWRIRVTLTIVQIAKEELRDGD